MLLVGHLTSVVLKHFAMEMNALDFVGSRSTFKVMVGIKYAGKKHF